MASRPAADGLWPGPGATCARVVAAVVVAAVVVVVVWCTSSGVGAELTDVGVRAYS